MFPSCVHARARATTLGSLLPSTSPLHRMAIRTSGVRARKVTIKGPRPPSKPHGGRTKKTVNKDDDDPSASADSKGGILRVLWNDARTDRLVDWLENNVEDRQRLFSDSSQDAKDENRRRRTAKNVKTSFHIKMANYIFSLDEDAKTRDDLRTNGAKKYAKSVENRITR